MKKKSKFTGGASIIPAPHAAESVKTERTAVALLMHWMREIIEDKQLELGLPDVETISTDRKMPDLVIYESHRSKQVLCVMEAKPPHYDAFDETSLKNSARQKATNRKARYFVLTNFKQLVWFNTESVNAMKPEEEQIIGRFELSSIENLEDIESITCKNAIKEGLEDFLSRLYNVHTGKEAEPKLPIDELLISRIHEKIRVLAFYYKDIIRDKCHKQSEFAVQLKTWFKDQGWSFAWQMNDFYKAARQTAYLLVNKILFYNLLQTKRLADLDPLEIPASLTRGSLLKNHLHGYFAQVLKIDYKTIYTTDFIDEIAYPEDKRVITEIKKLIDILRRYDFSILGYDIIGRIFEQLIPMEERHNLGQYFTNADVVDLILKFSSHHEDEIVLDPSCGAGTFLVRAYQHKKMMNLRKKHALGRFYNEKILSREDISPREFLDFNGDSQIVRDLFGWKLYSGKQHIECRSHEEARFLKVFFEAGMDTVMVPADDDYLKSILPELEKLQKTIEDAIGMFADGIMSLRLKEQLRRKVYLQLLN